jgi:hypothetical protein
MFSTSKVKRRQKFVWDFPTEFAGSTQNPKKIIETPNLPNRTKIFPINYVPHLKSVKQPKNRIGATRQNLQAQPKISKKLSENQFNQLEQKCS